MAAAAALIPVVLFLTVLYLLDSFKLVRPRAIAGALAAGGACALILWWFHEDVLGLDHLRSTGTSRYIAPLTEETGKALVVLALLATGRIGFVVDAAVLGFSIGAGFALVENVTYLRELSSPSIGLWLVRGLGTAVLQGATTAIVAMSAKALSARRRGGLGFLFGLAAAIVFHSAFNHLLLPPVAQTAVILVVFPLLMVWIFDRSEQATREWVSAGMDLDLELLQLVGSDSFTVTRFAEYLRELRARFPGPVVANMYCLLRLDLELAVQAKAFVMARSAGLELKDDGDRAAATAERDYLVQSIGRVGLLALKPLQLSSRRDRWHRHVLK